MTPVDLFILFAGPFVGSFVGTVADRHVLQRSWATGRSQCEGCEATLGPLDLVPLASWAALRGNCRHCHAPISVRYPLIESAALLIGVAAVMLTPSDLAPLSAMLGWALLAIALIDLRTLTIPDWLSLPLIPLGLMAGYLMSGWDGVLAHALGAAVAGLSMIALALGYARVRGRQGLGGGDIKLFAAAGAWVGLGGLPFVVLGAALTALIATAVKATAGDFDINDKLPFGPFIGLGLWTTWLFYAASTWIF